MSGELAGNLREQVTLEASRPRDAAGAATGDPVAGEPLWASVEVLPPRVGVEADRPDAPARYRIVLRDGTAIAGAGARLRWRGVQMVVRAATRDPARPGVLVLEAETR
jgi:head-tail adaptor